MQPIYEREIDRERERACAVKLQASGYITAPTVTTSKWDITMFTGDGRMDAVVEFKWRRKRYPTLKIDKSKIDGVINVAKSFNVRPILVIQWKDFGYFYWHCHQDSLTSPMTRTEPRGIAGEVMEAADRCYEIPVSEFEELSC